MVTVTYMNQSSCGRMPLQFLRMSRGPETKMLEDHYLRLIFWGDMDSGKSTLKKKIVQWLTIILAKVKHCVSGVQEQASSHTVRGDCTEATFPEGAGAIHMEIFKEKV